MAVFRHPDCYTQSETDRCIFRKIVNKQVYLLVVYVDDILIIATNEEIERLGKHFMEVYRWITLDVGDAQLYLGMQLTFVKGAVKIDMRFYG